MDDTISGAAVAAYRKRLLAERETLNLSDQGGADAQKTVMLDQQSVGRLSRMDALQGQAMAQATQRRRATRRTRIDAALARIDDGEFGYCTDCGEVIASGRLDLDPTVSLCLSCAKG